MEYFLFHGSSYYLIDPGDTTREAALIVILSCLTLLSDMELLIIGLLALSSVIQIYFWYGQLDALNRRKDREVRHFSEPPSVAVIIAVKNELPNLKKNLPLWVDQDYPHLKLIIVDDHSMDGSIDYLKSCSYMGFEFVLLPNGLEGKKAALAFGIDHINSEWIITTDADCRPNSKDWIRRLMSDCESKDVILGYSPYRHNGSMLSKWITYESWYIALQYLSASVIGQTYMGVGRNLALRRSVYEATDGYRSHMDIKGGDDDLFITSLGKDCRFGIAIHPDSWVWTDPVLNISKYIRQKRRHLTTSPRYKWPVKIRLTVIYLSQIMWYISVAGLFFIYPLMAGVFILGRYLLLMIVALRAQDSLGDQTPFWQVPLWDFLLSILYFFFSFFYLKPLKDW